MKNLLATSAALAAFFMFTSCNQSADNQEKTMSNSQEQTEHKGQSAVQDDMSAKNVVQVAMGSKDHTTLVTAVKAAELVDALSNAAMQDLLQFSHQPMPHLINYQKEQLSHY